MARTKTIHEYEAEIKKLHGLDDTPKVHKKLKNQLRKWASMVNVVVRVASNEQNPWTTNEIGLQVLPMELKSISGFNQVGDYIFEIFREREDTITGNLVVERKTKSDLYGTLMNSRQRERFYNELSRYEKDPRFTKMIIMAECTLDDFIDYIPKIYVFGWDSVPGTGAQKLATYLKNYYRIKDIQPHQIHKLDNGRQVMAITTSNTILIQLEANNIAGLYIDGMKKDSLVVEKKYGKMNLLQCKGATEESKMGTVARFLSGDVQPQWCGSRERAVELYRYMIRHSMITDYERILGLGDQMVDGN